MAEERVQLPHSLALKDRRVLTLTGVTEVVSFDDTMVTLQTQMGRMQVHGENLQVKNLSLEGGQMALEGTISALIYQQQPQSGWLHRLLGG